MDEDESPDLDLHGLPMPIDTLQVSVLRATEIFVSEIQAGHRPEEKIGDILLRDLIDLQDLRKREQHHELGILLVTIAALMRVADDRAKVKMLNTPLPGFVVHLGGYSGGETIREACNKIIHARKVRRRGAADPVSGPLSDSKVLHFIPKEPVTPIIHLIGSNQDKHWYAEIHLGMFLEAAAYMCRRLRSEEEDQRASRRRFARETLFEPDTFDQMTRTFPRPR